MTKEHRYLSYLLRLWQTGDGKKQVWRASLQSPNDQERRGLASLEELVDFLYPLNILGEMANVGRICYPTRRRLAKPPYICPDLLRRYDFLETQTGHSGADGGASSL
jgi:hypothetical protein